MATEYDVPAGAFSGVDKATGQYGGGSYEGPGRFFEVIEEVKFVPKRGGGNGVAIEKTVLHVLSAPEKFHDGKPGVLVDYNPPSVGARVTDFIDMGKDYWADAMASFLGTCFGTDPKDVTEADSAKACGPDQPCKGIVVEVTNTEKENRPKTVVYSRIRYDRVVPASDLAAVLSEAGIDALGGPEVMTALLDAEKTT